MQSTRQSLILQFVLIALVCGVETTLLNFPQSTQVRLAGGPALWQEGPAPAKANPVAAAPSAFHKAHKAHAMKWRGIHLESLPWADNSPGAPGGKADKDNTQLELNTLAAQGQTELSAQEQAVKQHLHREMHKLPKMVLASLAASLKKNKTLKELQPKVPAQAAPDNPTSSTAKPVAGKTPTLPPLTDADQPVTVLASKT